MSKAFGRQTASLSGSNCIKSLDKIERPPHYENLLHSEILQSQQKDDVLIDTLLICDGGTIRAHAFILVSASSLIQLAIASQGENYPHTREILIPDFSIEEIAQMLSLIYKGYVDLSTEEEAYRLQETLKFFGVSNFVFSTAKFDKIDGSLKVQVQQLNRKDENEEPEIIVLDLDSSSPTSRKSFKTENPIKVSTTPSPSPQRNPQTLNLNKDKKADRSSEFEVSGQEQSDREISPRKRVKTKDTLQPVVKLRRIDTHQKSIVTPTTTTPAVVQNSPMVTVAGANKKDANNGKDPKTDTEDEDFESPDYKDQKWCYHESRRCQSCKKTFDNPADAANCISSHKVLRCYFCFRVYTTTEILYRHYKKRHKQAGRAETLVCSFCGQVVPYKSVSVHFISAHLKEFGEKPDSHKKKENENGDKGTKSPKKKPSTSKSNESRNGPPGRPSATPTSTGKEKAASRRRSLSHCRSVSTERVNSCERDEQTPIKRPKNTVSASSSLAATSSAKKKSPTKKKNTDSEDETKEKELKVPDFNFILTKEMASGETITFKLQKKRSDGENISNFLTTIRTNMGRP